MRKYSIRQHLGLGLLALGATLAQGTMIGTAYAGDEQSKQAITLRDLDLSKEADVARLYRRIRAAAESVCGDGQLTGTRISNSAQVHCIAAAMDRAVASINKAEVSAYHRHESAKSGA